MTHRAVWKIVDSNTQTFDMYGTHQGGKEMKMLEIAYTGSLNEQGKPRTEGLLTLRARLTHPRTAVTCCLSV